jgi:hypothetical protein
MECHSINFLTSKTRKPLCHNTFSAFFIFVSLLLYSFYIFHFLLGERTPACTPAFYLPRGSRVKPSAKGVTLFEIGEPSGGVKPLEDWGAFGGVTPHENERIIVLLLLAVVT